MSPPPSSSQPSQTTASSPPSSPSDPSAPPPSPPMAVPAAPPPLPATPPPTSSPPLPPDSPPPSPPASTPPSPITSPPPSATAAPPPNVTSPPPPDLSPPPPEAGSPPPQASDVPPAAVPPRSPPNSHSSPPPAHVPTPQSSSSPPPPQGKPPASTPSPPTVTPPPSSSQAPPSTNVPPPAKLPSSPPLAPSIPSSSSPPPISSPASPTNSSATRGRTASPPSVPTEKPTGKSTDSNMTTNASSGGGLKNGGVVAIGIVVGFLFISLLVMAMWFVHKRKKGTRSRVDYTGPSPFSSSQSSDNLFLKPQSPSPFLGLASGSGNDYIYSPSEPGGVSNSRSWFTYEELVQATNGFSANNLLGEGGFGYVYKGLLADGREVAVKQLKVGSGQGEREFSAEVEIISRVHHRHLVSLVGYCISEHQRLLVYDFVPNNNLHYHLHGANRPVLDWATRVKVAAGAARGIAYLHEDCHPRIIHRDIKSSNILLDHNFEAKVSDFGLAKLVLELDTNTHVTTRVMGTFGYMAPEYATSGKLTEKSDVYSFGVVLLELITGQKPVDDSRPVGDESLVEWARPLLAKALDSENFEVVVDPRLEESYNRIEMFRMIEAAAVCVRHSSAKRPRMSQVVRALDSLDELTDLNNGMKPGQSSIFDSAQQIQSAQIRMFRRMAFGSQDCSTGFFNDSFSSWGSRESENQIIIFPQNRSSRTREQENQSRFLPQKRPDSGSGNG